MVWFYRPSAWFLVTAAWAWVGLSAVLVALLDPTYYGRTLVVGTFCIAVIITAALWQALRGETVRREYGKTHYFQ